MFGKGRSRKENPEVNSSSMADIAFLLLVFFLVATQIPVKDQGIKFLLPKKLDENKPPVDVEPRNLLKVMVNSGDKLLVNDERLEISELKEKAKKFINNRKKDPKLSDSPKKAVISLRIDRGTTHKVSIRVLDELQGAYYELQADYLGMTLKDYLALDEDDAIDSRLIRKAKDVFPMRLSKAEPTR